MNRKKEESQLKKRFGDYLLDVSKYVLTAVLISMSFKEISVSKGWTYLIGYIVVAGTLVWGLYYYRKS